MRRKQLQNEVVWIINDEFLSETKSNARLNYPNKLVLREIADLGGMMLSKPIKISLASMLGSLYILGYNPADSTIFVGINNDWDAVSVYDLQNDIAWEKMSPTDIKALEDLESRLGLDVPNSDDDLMPGSRLVPEHFRRSLTHKPYINEAEKKFRKPQPGMLRSGDFYTSPRYDELVIRHITDQDVTFEVRGDSEVVYREATAIAQANGEYTEPYHDDFYAMVPLRMTHQECLKFIRDNHFTWSHRDQSISSGFDLDDF
jgi:hypothetical protein